MTYYVYILSNITMASPNIPIEKVWEAAEKAGIIDDIKKMPMGIKTIVSEGSRGISGGQKQLLNLASVMVMQPSVLIHHHNNTDAYNDQLPHCHIHWQ